MCAAAAAVTSEGHISRRDLEFVGPDRRLKELVARRQALAPAQSQVFAMGTHRNNISMRQLKPIYHKYFDHDIETYFREKRLTLHEPHFMVVRIMKFLIYGVQKRMVDFQRIVAKYEKDDRLRIGFIIAKLDEWQKKMLHMVSYILDQGIYMRVRVHLLYYQRLCQINADVSYTVELLAQEQASHEQARERAAYKQSGITSQQARNFRQLQGALQHFQGVNLTQKQLLAIEKNLEASGIKYF